MRKVNWMAQRVVARLGWPGIAGLIFFLLAATVHGVMDTHEMARQDDLRATSLTLAASLKKREDQPKGPDTAELAMLFYRTLPSSTTEQRTGVIASIQSAALAEGLVLEQASFSIGAATKESFDGLEIALPVRGGYPKIRRFMRRALVDNPALALDAVSFSRQAVNEPTVDVQLRFTLYLQKP